MRIKNFTVPLFLFALVNAIATSSIASEWISFGRNDKFDLFIDMESLRIDGPNVKVWKKKVYTSPQIYGTSSPQKKYSAEKILEIYRCDRRNFSVLEFILYADYACYTTVESYSRPDEPLGIHERIVPDSMGEFVLEFVCSIRAKPTAIITNRQNPLARDFRVLHK